MALTLPEKWSNIIYVEISDGSKTTLNLFPLILSAGNEENRYGSPATAFAGRIIEVLPLLPVS